MSWEKRLIRIEELMVKVISAIDDIDWEGRAADFRMKELKEAAVEIQRTLRSDDQT